MKTMGILTAEIVARKYAGKDIAFAASVDDSCLFWRLSVVVKDESGHEPLPWQLAWGTEDEMRQHADYLNDKALHLTRAQVVAYVASSMQGSVRQPSW